MRYGTREDTQDGRLVRIVDRTGQVWAELAWHGDALERLSVPGVTVRGTTLDDPLLGLAHPIVDASGDVLTTVSAIDWARPVEIPAIAAPGRLPHDAGGAILNVLSQLAARTGVPALRYAGPYPTSALWHALARSFRTTGTEADFTRDLVDRMARLARDPIPIDFVPAPHERVVVASDAHVQLRDGVERFVWSGCRHCRLVAASPGDRAAAAWHAEMWLGDRAVARIATLTADGTLLDGPHPVPPCESEVIGKTFPPALVAALAELISELVPPPLARAARRSLADSVIVWADLGGELARIGSARLEVHAALWIHVGPHGMARLALALAEALAPVVTRAVVRDATLAAHPGGMS
jgi:hypothetical protein